MDVYIIWDIITLLNLHSTMDNIYRIAENIGFHSRRKLGGNLIPRFQPHC